jgi:hypothetical protein
MRTQSLLLIRCAFEPANQERVIGLHRHKAGSTCRKSACLRWFLSDGLLAIYLQVFYVALQRRNDGSCTNELVLPAGIGIFRCCA